jgi:hypothetical protein
MGELRRRGREGEGTTSGGGDQEGGWLCWWVFQLQQVALYATVSAHTEGRERVAREPMIQQAQRWGMRYCVVHADCVH